MFPKAISAAKAPAIAAATAAVVSISLRIMVDPLG
jgi:hypothetical protein